MLAGAALALSCSQQSDEPPSNAEPAPPPGSEVAAPSTGDRSTSPATSPAAGQTAPAASQAAAPSAGQPPQSTLGTAAPAPNAPPPQTASDAEAGFHLDDPEVEYELPRRTARPRKGRTIQIVLRSSPPGAVAAVDGVAVGPTPTLWEGTVDATPREFTFVLPGYAIARYRFVPMRSGIVHGTLEPIKAEGEDGDRRNRPQARPTEGAPPGPAR